MLFMWNQFNKPLNLQCNEAKGTILSKHIHVTPFMFCFSNTYGYWEVCREFTGITKIHCEKISLERIKKFYKTSYDLENNKFVIIKNHVLFPYV